MRRFEYNLNLLVDTVSNTNINSSDNLTIINVTTIR